MSQQGQKAHRSRAMSPAPTKGNEDSKADVSRGESKPVMPVGFKAALPNAIVGLVILSGCMLMVSLRPDTTILGYKPWFGIVTVGGLPAFGMVMVFLGSLADISASMMARHLKVETKFGAYFDELADLAAFGIGPAVHFMRFCRDGGGSPHLVFLAGYTYMLASVFRISRELVVHRGRRPLFFMGVNTNMAGMILSTLVFIFDRYEMTGRRRLPLLVFLLSAMMAAPMKLYKDPTGLFISFAEQKRSMQEADRIEEQERKKAPDAQPVMPIGFKAQIPNAITGIVILSGCILTTSASVLGCTPKIGVGVVCIGLVADIADGLTARVLNVGTKFGAYFDELADLTAFGIGPAVFLMRHCIDQGSSFVGACMVGYLYMLASVYRISRELVVHRGHRPKFFVGVTTNMASLVLVSLVFTFDSFELSHWLPLFVCPLIVLMAVPRKFYKDPTGLFISFEEQKRSIQEADKAEKLQ